MTQSPASPGWIKGLLVVLVLVTVVLSLTAPPSWPRLAFLLIYSVWGTALILLFVLNIRDRAARQRRKGVPPR